MVAWGQGCKRTGLAGSITHTWAQSYIVARPLWALGTQVPVVTLPSPSQPSLDSCQALPPHNLLTSP